MKLFHSILSLATSLASLEAVRAYSTSRPVAQAPPRVFSAIGATTGKHANFVTPKPTAHDLYTGGAPINNSVPFRSF